MIDIGTLTVIDAHGRTHVFKGSRAGRACTIRLHDASLHYRLPFNPKLYVGEAVMDGTLTVEDAEVYEFFALLAENLGWGEPAHWAARLRHAWLMLTKRLLMYNPIPRAQRNVAHHYDLSDRLYELFLDTDWQYSCAYFASPDDTLDKAQERKKKHIAAKLLLEPGQKVLDIGSGWGGLALSLAKFAEVDVTGITLSREQLKFANARAEREGLSDRVRFQLKDYREVDDRFDRIVSVGMFEHVGSGHYDTYFDRLSRLLADDGVALLHTIGRAEPPGATNPWINKYIFPGGYVPALSEVLASIERRRLYVTDIEVLRLHYAETLRAWRRRFQANRAQIRALYDERFCRMWELYLVMSEVAFRYTGLVVFQVQLTKDQAAVPLTRDYVTEFEGSEGSARWRAA
jgi:cyclopropane-fatty-acyl-phospholipid synthase